MKDNTLLYLLLAGGAFWAWSSMKNGYGYKTTITAAEGGWRWRSSHRTARRTAASK